MYRLTFTSPLHADPSLEEGPWHELAAACARADAVVEEYLSVLHQPTDHVGGLLQRYANHGERPTVVEVATGLPVYCPNIEKQVAGWVSGDSAARWVPPHP